METEAASETLCFFKKLRLWTSPKTKIVSANVSHALFSHLDFLTPEDGTDGLSSYFGKELVFYAA
jgi:hypothetical protein